MFSRVAERLHSPTNALYQLRDRLVSEGAKITDFVSGNVNEHGIEFPPESLQQALVRAARQSRVYRPDSFGQFPARQAISEYYRQRGLGVPPEHILLTPGTSISYWYCFKLLADEGDEILCPAPSYPLFDYIAALSGVQVVSYRLDERRGWAIDVENLEALISTKTRALVLISPHNPTGHVSDPAELAEIADIAARHRLAIISDEVFSEFLLNDREFPRIAAGNAPLVFTLNGFSKLFALPGMKLGWIAVSGDPGKRDHALRALEMISDTFLPVNEIAQAAAPDVFLELPAFGMHYVQKIRRRWSVAQTYLANCTAWSYVKPAGGFYLTLRIDSDDEQTAEAILREQHVLVHPGHFYDIRSPHLVFSFVPQAGSLHEGLPRLLRVVAEMAERHGSL